MILKAAVEVWRYAIVSCFGCLNSCEVGRAPGDGVK